MSRFPSTNWALVDASRDRSPERCVDPLAELCARYWRPVYAFLRQHGHAADDAEDLTQGFFAHVLEKRVIERAAPERGRLRSLLLVCLQHFVANEHARQRTKKRGGPGPAAHLASFDAAAIKPRLGATPEMLYERQWTVALLARVLDRLRAELAEAGKVAVFPALRDCLIGNDRGYRAVANALGTSESTARVAVHRLRKRYGTLLRDEVARTLRGSEAEITDELRYLLSVVQRADEGVLS